MLIPNFIGKQENPKMLDIYITDKCNLLCKMCNIGMNNRNGTNNPVGRASNNQTTDSISTDMIRKLVSDVAKWDPKINVFISGGEPLLVKEKLYCIIEECARHGIAIGMNSNGMNITQEVAETLVGLGLGGITLSVDGCRETHDEIRGVRGSFERVRQAADFLKTARCNTGKPLPMVMVLLAISSNNYSSLLDTITELDGWDLDAITFSQYAFTSNSQMIAHNKIYSDTAFQVDSTVGGFYSITKDQVNSIDFELFADQIEKVRTYVSTSKIKSFKFYPNLFTVDELKDYYLNDIKPMNKYFHTNCVWFAERIDIDCDGQVMLGYPCFRVNLGNIRNNNIKDLWRSRKARKIRDFTKNNPNMPACLRCCGNRIKLL